MKRSTDRLLTSHAGALPRPDNLQHLFNLGDSGAPAFNEALPAAVREVVQQQVAAGLDVVNDGEFSKRGGYSGYARQRLSGLEQREYRAGQGHQPRHVAERDRLEFPGFFATGLGEVGIRRGSNPAANPVICTGPITYTGQVAVQADIRSLQMAIAGTLAEGYLPAITPGTVEHWLFNEHYPDDEAFMFAIADALHHEYKAITDAGLVLQVDDPDLADGWQIHPEMTLAAYREFAELRVEALNRALQGIPADRVRLHVCWGSGHGPHKNDLPLKDIADLMLRVRAQCYLVEAANPRHEHEWLVWEEVKLPPGKILMPGVVGHATDIVEHPELVAQRLLRFAGVVGQENLIAGTDCGLGYRVGHPEVVWAKLTALTEGARLATRQLWR